MIAEDLRFVVVVVSRLKDGYVSHEPFGSLFCPLLWSPLSSLIIGNFVCMSHRSVCTNQVLKIPSKCPPITCFH